MTDMYIGYKRYNKNYNLKSLSKEEIKDRLRYFPKVNEDETHRWLYYKFLCGNIDFGLVEYSDDLGRVLVRRMTWNSGYYERYGSNGYQPYIKGYKTPPKKYRCFNANKIDDIVRAIKLGILIVDESSSGYRLREGIECFRTYRAAKRAVK